MLYFYGTYQEKKKKRILRQEKNICFSMGKEKDLNRPQ